MQIKKLKLSDINTAPYNPRKDLKPADPQYKKLERSIEEFGLVEPLVWNKNTERLIGGHQRLKVLQSKGYTEVEVVVVDLPEEREKALNLALNKIEGEWDDEMLADLLKEINDFDDGALCLLTGFDADMIESIVTDLDGFNKINHNQGADRAGTSPWERMVADGKPGTIFSFGSYTCRLPEELYNKFVKRINDQDVSGSVSEVLSAALRNT